MENNGPLSSSPSSIGGIETPLLHGRGRRFKVKSQIDRDIQNKTDRCCHCGKFVFWNERISVSYGKVFHRQCVNFSKCGKVLGNKYQTLGTSFFCKPHFAQFTMRSK